MRAASVNRETFLAALSRIEDLIAGSGLNLAHVVILHLLQESEPLSNSELSSLSGFPPPTVSRCMAKLAALNMVRVTLDEADLRKNSFRLEARARSVLFEIKRSVPADLDTVLRMYAEMIRASRNLLAEPQRSLSPNACRVLLAFDGSTAESVGELCAKAALGQSSVSMALASLRKHGLAARTKSTDARQRLHMLTELGLHARQALCCALPLHQE